MLATLRFDPFSSEFSLARCQRDGDAGLGMFHFFSVPLHHIYHSFAQARSVRGCDVFHLCGTPPSVLSLILTLSGAPTLTRTTLASRTVQAAVPRLRPSPLGWNLPRASCRSSHLAGARATYTHGANTASTPFLSVLFFRQQIVSATSRLRDKQVKS